MAELLKEFSNSEGTYGSTSVGKLIWTSSSTKVFVLPSADNRDNEDAYAIGSRSLLETWGTNDVDSYRSAEHNKPAAAEVLPAFAGAAFFFCCSAGEPHPDSGGEEAGW